MINHLPHELIINVFYIATYNTIRDPDSIANPPHFAYPREIEADKLNDEALRTKIAISSVCSLWRGLSLEFMYEDIIIRHGVQVLADVLENGIQTSMGRTRGLGHYVRRIQLSTMGGVASQINKPRSQDISAFDARLNDGDVPKRVSRLDDPPWFDVIGRHTAQIFRSCPNTIHLDRYRDIFCRPSKFLQYFFQPNNESVIQEFRDIHLLNVVRIDWDAGRSPHSLGSYLMPCFAKFQSLQVLALSGQDWGSDWKLTCPKLTTVYMSTVFDSPRPGIENDKVAIPSASRLVVRDAGNLSDSLTPFNPSRIRTIEIDRVQNLYKMSYTQVLSLLLRCSNLEELFYPIFFVRWDRAVLSLGTPLTKLKTIGLDSKSKYLNDNDDPGYMIDHFSILCDPQSPFVALERIILCGAEWEQLRKLEGFRNVEFLTQNSGIKVVEEDS